MAFMFWRKGHDLVSRTTTPCSKAWRGLSRWLDIFSSGTEYESYDTRLGSPLLLRDLYLTCPSSARYLAHIVPGVRCPSLAWYLLHIRVYVTCRIQRVTCSVLCVSRQSIVAAVVHRRLPKHEPRLDESTHTQ